MASIFRDNGTSTNWSNTGANTTYSTNSGMFGTLGASPSVHVNFSGASYVFEGTEKNLGATAIIFQFFMRPASTATLNSGVTIFTVWDSTYSNSPIRIDIFQNSATTYKFSLIDASNGYAYTGGTTAFTIGMTVEINLYQTSAGWTLAVAGMDNTGTIHTLATNEITYTYAQATVGWQYVSVGTHYQNAATSYVGVIDFGEFWVGNFNTTPSTAAQISAEVWEGYKQQHLAVSGQPYRGPQDGQNLSYASGYIDTVSESAAYLLMLAVQNNDQASFILCDNWVLNNFLRSKSTSANTNTNAAPTTALNLMCFKYNSANSDGKGIATIYDANFATDADNERMQALFWAHSRFGSSASTVGSAPELVAPNYLQRALNVASDLRLYSFQNSSATGYNYQGNDSFQTGIVMQIGGDYDAPAAFKLAAQYDTANTSFWNNAVLGSYDGHTKAANVIFSGATPAQSTTAKLIPQWFALTVSTAVVSTTPSTYGNSDYDFNSFRYYARLYDMWNWYADSTALSTIQLVKSFFTNEWSTNSKIRTTFKHDGTNTGNYESNVFTFAAYWTIYANDTGNTTASAIKSGKLSNLFYQKPYGSIISDTSGGSTANYSYYASSLDNRDYMRMNGLWVNYGQVTVTTSSVSTALLMGV